MSVFTYNHHINSSQYYTPKNPIKIEHQNFFSFIFGPDLSLCVFEVSHRFLGKITALFVEIFSPPNISDPSVIIHSSLHRNLKFLFLSIDETNYVIHLQNMYSTKTVKISNSDTQIINLVPAQKRIQYEKSRIIKKCKYVCP